MSKDTENLNIKVLRPYKVALRQLATEKGEPVSVVIRWLLRDGLEREGHPIQFARQGAARERTTA